MEGYIPAGGFVDCTITYNPSQSSANNKIDEDKLFLKVIF
jgi:hypothetical protein